MKKINTSFFFSYEHFLKMEFVDFINLHSILPCLAFVLME